MRFTSIYLQNYIGIYNGMKLNEVFIDFTLCKYRTLIIRGDNGSGKSTLMRALTVFPDGSDSFIPGLPAKKEITLGDGPVSYKLTFIHGVKGNGDRDNTKAFASKSVNGSEYIILNDNGNVTSFKDILFDELGLDSNFIALSQLSTDDRGIADKKPAERKRFVNSILNTLDVYNDIYKTLTKRSSVYKNLINSLSAKLGSLGDPESIARNVEAIDGKINIVQDKKDQAIEALAKSKAQVQILDPDGSIQAIMDRINADDKELKTRLTMLMNTNTSIKLANNISLTENIRQLFDNATSSYNNASIDNQINRGKVESLLKEREDETKELSSKLAKLQTFETETYYEDTMDQIAAHEQELEYIRKDLMITGIDDILSISRDEYILALQTIKDIGEKISVFKDSFDYTTLSEVVAFYTENGVLPEKVDYNNILLEKQSIEKEIDATSIKIIRLESDIKALETLSIRPSKCTIDSCPFIKDSVLIEKQCPRETYQRMLELLKSLKERYNEISSTLDSIVTKNACISSFYNIVRELDKNKGLLSKIPMTSIFTDKVELIRSILSGEYSKYTDTIYSYIDKANLLDEFRAITNILNKLYADKNIYESKYDILLEIQSDIDRINTKIDDIIGQITPIQDAIASNDKFLILTQKRIGVYQSLLDNEDDLQKLNSLIEQNTQLYNQNADKIRQIDLANGMMIRQVETINNRSSELVPLMGERDRLNHSLRLTDDYRKELDEYNNEYSVIETIRYYSSPTTGIQLVFMELYMGKIIELANQLLSMFFNGQFNIMPFIINESEFRIPCSGDGIMNDDISSMSSAQISMISMILSFSFLCNSSTKYNILKLDEIDGPLDGNNRLMFIDVLGRVMDMMGTEQCIMISHNSELQVDQSDVIILKSSENSDYVHGNIIWKY